MKNPKKIYISGPITGRPVAQAEAEFAYAAERLASRGWQVVNPMSLPVHETHDQSYAAYMREDLRELLDCGAIYMLPGWHNSRGARCEKHVAEMLELSVFFGQGFLGSFYPNCPL
jgi:Asp-tRNA(Asn)/Glu-tRNA(Gln) amidotransferase A subunit family amidase